MVLSSSAPSGGCRECGAPLKLDQAQCWLCQSKPVATTANKAGAGRPVDSRAAYQYSLSSLLLIMTLIAILCSIFNMHPGLGIAGAIFAVPALVRTCLVASGRRARGQTLTPGGKVSVFLLTLAMIVTVLVAAGAAFFFTCLATLVIGNFKPVGTGSGANSAGNTLLLAGFTLSLVVALAIGISLTWLFWKLSHRKRNPCLHCPDCGAPLKPDQTRCWVCHDESREACLLCGQMIPAGASKCPDCGWTWKSEDVENA
ncbi:MAG: hypothetical protein NTY19_41735 [Planctomycetota bacterium]|nr:hypothetical protein [Planctomycetota bacterium]